MTLQLPPGRLASPALALLLVAASRVAGAQGGFGVAAGAAQHEAARDAASHRTPDADTTVVRRAAPPVAALVLAHRVALGLTLPQLAGLAELAAHLDSVIPPLEAEIDGLAVRGTAEEWRALTPERAAVLREQARRRGALVAALHEERRRARESALALLSDAQRAQALELERDERRVADERLRRTRNGGWSGFGGARADSSGSPR